MGRAAVAALLLPLCLLPARVSAQAESVTWRLDNLERIGGHAVRTLGAPRVVQTELGPAVEFNGKTDGLVVEANPIAGLRAFTIELLFQPDDGGPDEQRFLHIEEAGETGSRALIELRMLPGGSSWALDTFLRNRENGLTLLDRSKSHPAARWHTAALVYDGRVMQHYVNGKRELSGEIEFPIHEGGRTSLGVRQTLVSWFKGRIHSVRITAAPLPPAALMRVPGSESPDIIPLWPEGVPGAKPDGGVERLEDGRVYNVQVPTLTHLPPTSPATGTAVIVCPGGSYARLAIAIEADAIAPVLRAAGAHVFVLKYRLVEFGHPAPLQDVLRSVRILRSRAAEFGIKADRIGIFGASAGGHLAATAATLFDSPEGKTGHALDGVSGRPDFVALLYPVITMEPPNGHQGSRQNLLGATPAPDLIARLSADKMVTRETPPAFLIHTNEDRSVPVENSILFYQALRRAGVPAELHLYDRGPHGFGGRKDLGTTSGWTDRLIEWMKSLQAEAR